MNFITVKEYLFWAECLMGSAKLYFGHGTDDAWNEACAILITVLGLPLDCALTKYSNIKLSARQRATLTKITNKRVTSKLPLPYIFGYCYYMGYKFFVNKKVLVPRSPFAEIIRAKFKPWGLKNKNILELGTGCGALAILCAKHIKNATIHATDISLAALKVAQKNLQQHKIGSNKIKLFKSDWFNNVPAKKYDIIFTNPPYVSMQEYRVLPQEYKHEPQMALCAKQHGLAEVLKILQEAGKFLAFDGVLFVEVGGTQQAFSKRYPQLPVFWVDIYNGEDGIFGIYQRDLVEYNKKYA